MTENRQARKRVEEPGTFKSFCNFVAGAAPVIGGVVSAAAPPLAPIAAPLGALVGVAAKAVSYCSVM